MPLSSTTLFEYERRPFAWTDRDLAALERLNRAAGVDVLQATVYRGVRALRATQHVGVVRFGPRTVQVLPKIYKGSAPADESQRARQATHNLLYLLAYAGQVPIREHEVAPLLRRDLDWFEILTRLFATHLMRLWQRGPYRQYQIVEDELPVLKGKWRISEQLRRPDRQHAFAVIYDEFTADTLLNRVLRFVVERLWRLTRDTENRRQLGVLRQWMDGITVLSQITVAEADRITLTRLNQHYEPLLNLARLFLDNSALQLAIGDHTTFAFVFDMNALFEAFVANFIRRHRDQILPVSLQKCELLPQTSGATRHLARHQNHHVFRLKPDLAFRVGQAFPVLLDTKYKRLDAADTRLGVSEGDFYQMYAYAQRYDCRQVVLLYPQTAGMTAPLRARFLLEDEQKTIRVETLDIRVDLGSPEGREHIIHQLRTILEVKYEQLGLA